MTGIYIYICILHPTNLVQHVYTIIYSCSLPISKWASAGPEYVFWMWDLNSWWSVDFFASRRIGIWNCPVLEYLQICSDWDAETRWWMMEGVSNILNRNNRLHTDVCCLQITFLYIYIYSCILHITKPAQMLSPVKLLPGSSAWSSGWTYQCWAVKALSQWVKVGNE